MFLFYDLINLLNTEDIINIDKYIKKNPFCTQWKQESVKLIAFIHVMDALSFVDAVC